MVATPILAGAMLRFAMGLLVDRLSPKTAGLIGQVVVIVALACAWHLGVAQLEQVLLLGVFLGVAGASFAVSLPLASQWYHRSTRARPWASPAPATPAPCSPRCWRRCWRRPTAGTTCSVSP
jgi:NNP family nitrate/nitrite transporter-like MFS transporter